MRIGVRRFLAGVALAGALAACSSTPPKPKPKPATPIQTVCRGALSEANGGTSTMLIATVQKAMSQGSATFATDVRTWLLETNKVTRKADAQTVVSDCRKNGGLPKS